MAFLLFLCALLWVCCDSVTIEELTLKYAPALYLYDFASLPSNGEVNSDPQTLVNGSIEVQYQWSLDCYHPNQLTLQYGWRFGSQRTCKVACVDTGTGDNDGDAEKVNVIIDLDVPASDIWNGTDISEYSQANVFAVVYEAHLSWFTRAGSLMNETAGEFGIEFQNDTHASVYVGGFGHGSYPFNGGSECNSCLYWEDPRPTTVTPIEWKTWETAQLTPSTDALTCGRSDARALSTACQVSDFNIEHADEFRDGCLHSLCLNDDLPYLHYCCRRADTQQIYFKNFSVPSSWVAADYSALANIFYFSDVSVADVQCKDKMLDEQLTDLLEFVLMLCGIAVGVIVACIVACVISCKLYLKAKHRSLKQETMAGNSDKKLPMTNVNSNSQPNAFEKGRSSSAAIAV